VEKLFSFDIFLQFFLASSVNVLIDREAIHMAKNTNESHGNCYQIYSLKKP